MNKRQWEDLARFMGINCHHRFRSQHQRSTGSPISSRCVDCDSGDGAWVPDVLWDHFGDLWAKIEWWLWSPSSQSDTCQACDFERTQFLDAKKSGDAKRIMLAGCELGAAIGAAMRQQEKKQ